MKINGNLHYVADRIVYIFCGLNVQIVQPEAAATADVANSKKKQ